MIVVLATDAALNVRKPWICDFRGTGVEYLANKIGSDGMRGLTDCVWIAPGTIDAND